MTSLEGNSAGILENALSSLSNRLNFGFKKINVDYQNMTIAEELKIVQRIFEGFVMDKKAFFISDHGFFDMSRYSVPSQYHCNLVTLVEDPR